MISAEQMMEIMYQNMLPALPHIPGTAPTVAQYRVMLLLIHLHLSDAESEPLYAQSLMEILSGGWDDLDEGKLAKAFCGSLEEMQVAVLINAPALSGSTARTF